MTRETDAGMFLLPANGLLKLPSEALGVHQLWCKISEIIIRTTCFTNPTRYMFYKVQCWVNNPVLDDFAIDPFTLQTLNGVSEFAVPIGNDAFSVSDYEQFCIRDLLQTSLKRAATKLPYHERNMKDAWCGVRLDQGGGMGIKFFTRDSPEPAAIYRSIWHESIYQPIEHVLSLISEKVIANTLNGNTNIVNVSYFVNGTMWYSYFKNEVLSPRIYERQEFFQLPK